MRRGTQGCGREVVDGIACGGRYLCRVGAQIMDCISVASLVELTSAPRHGYVRDLQTPETVCPTLFALALATLVAEHDARLGEMHVLLVLRDMVRCFVLREEAGTQLQPNPQRTCPLRFSRTVCYAMRRPPKMFTT